MTLEEKKTKMAVRLGWKRVKVYKWSEDGNMRFPKQWIDEVDLPRFDSDANTRKDILAVMLETQKRRLIDRLWWTNRPSIPVNDLDADERRIIALNLLLLELTQPDFLELAGQAMGLWEKFI